MKIPIEKLKAIILFFCTYTEPKFLGKVKLMKLIYFLDFMHVKKYVSPVTYDNYVHLNFGPIPSTILNLVGEVSDDFDNAELSDVISIERKPEADIHRIVPSRKFNRDDAKYFSESELKMMKAVCARYGKSNTKTIEEASKKEAPYIKTVSGENISYVLAAKDLDCEVSEEEIKLMSKIFQKDG